MHVREGLIALGLAPAWANQKDAQTVLELVLPKMYWEDVNEVFGAIGQLIRKKEFDNTIRQIVKRPQFLGIQEPVLKWMDQSQKKKNNKRKKPPSTIAVAARRSPPSAVNATSSTIRSPTVRATVAPALPS